VLAYVRTFQRSKLVGDAPEASAKHRTRARCVVYSRMEHQHGRERLYNGDTLKITTDYVNGFVYENGVLSFFGSPEGRVVNNGGTLQYEYAIADHQGNTRVVFTSATPAAGETQTGFETSSNFGNLNTLSSQAPMNRTPSGTTSLLLTGGNNSQVGSTLSFKVYPGDKVKAEAYAKYWNTSSTSGNLVNFASALTGAFGMSSGGSGESLNAYNSMNSFGGSAAAESRTNDDDTSPKGFITILLFDENYNLVDAGWDQLDGDYEQTGIEDNDPFDYLTREMTVKEEGFAYIFVSNENPTQVSIHFDDMKVTHTKSNVIQYNEYYPFGLQTSSSWTRENNENDFLYNAGNELNLNTGWYEMFYRGYDPALGRMLQVDPYASMYASHSTYNYGLNNPAMINDPNGGQSEYVPGMNYNAWRRTQFNAADIYSRDWDMDWAYGEGSWSRYGGDRNLTNFRDAINRGSGGGSGSDDGEEGYSGIVVLPVTQKVSGHLFSYEVSVHFVNGVAEQIAAYNASDLSLGVGFAFDHGYWSISGQGGFDMGYWEGVAHAFAVSFYLADPLPGEIGHPDSKIKFHAGTVEVGPAKGAAWLLKMAGKYKNAQTSTTQIGNFYKYTVSVPGKNGHTVYTKILNAEGKTMKWFHDTYDKTGKFLHRGWTEGSQKVHLWWDGVIQTLGPYMPR
jgi:RHS repeat-associated protein